MKGKLNILPRNDEADTGRFPSWLHRPAPQGNTLWKTAKAIEENRLHTVCEEAKCPNLTECWSKKTATFLAMGKACTRNCGFCDIDFSKEPLALDEEEPTRVAHSVATLGLKHVVITMVARDDLLDGGALHLKKIIRAIRAKSPQTTIEVLTSDFSGNLEALRSVLMEKPDVFNHNIETVQSLSPKVRHKATYERTLQVLHFAATVGRSLNPKLYVKSGLMVGLGETKEEVKKTLRDLHSAGCHAVTIGQYLQAGPKKLLVKAFIHPDTFKEYEEYGLSIGLSYVYSGPFVRSSYNAASLFPEH